MVLNKTVKTLHELVYDGCLDRCHYARFNELSVYFGGWFLAKR